MNVFILVSLSLSCKFVLAFSWFNSDSFPFYSVSKVMVVVSGILLFGVAHFQLVVVQSMIGLKIASIAKWHV